MQNFEMLSYSIVEIDTYDDVLMAEVLMKNLLNKF